MYENPGGNSPLPSAADAHGSVGDRIFGECKILILPNLIKFALISSILPAKSWLGGATTSPAPTALSWITRVENSDDICLIRMKMGVFCIFAVFSEMTKTFW